VPVSQKLPQKPQQKLAPLDSLFLYSETRDTMMHVAGLLTFSMPKKASKSFMLDLLEELRSNPEVFAPWNMKLKHPLLLGHPGQAWVKDEEFDLDYHVRRSALPSPGDERELGVLVSRLHSHPLDFTRPPWEMHVIEGLEGGRFALYIKIHHSLVDGYTGMKMLSRGLSADPKEIKPMFFQQQQPERKKVQKADKALLAKIQDIASQASNQWGSVKKITSAIGKLTKSLAKGGTDLISAFHAPQSVLNGAIGRNRRFATQQFNVSDLKALAKACGGTLNDIILALCAGGLRKFLLEMGQLPDKPLIAFLPVNIRPEGDEGGGNAVGAMLASLATNIENPKERLEAIIASTRSGKSQMQAMSSGEIMAYSGLLMSPMGIQVLRAMSGLSSKLPVTCNVCISNVPGPNHALYFRGAKLEATYPVSIPAHGMALNITCQSYNDTLNFGFIGCRDTLPHLQRLAVYTGETFQELQKILKTKADAPVKTTKTKAA
jgi:diacylglycerol O-acyltransferase / wax synthase